MIENIEKKLKGILSDEALTLLLGSDALSELLAEKERLEEALKREQETTKYLRDAGYDKDTKITKLGESIVEWEEREEDVKAREAEVRKREFDHAIREERLNNAMMRGDEMKGIVHSFTRNMETRRQVFGEDSVVVPGIPGTPGYKDQWDNYVQPEYPESGRVERTPSKTDETETKG